MHGSLRDSSSPGSSPGFDLSSHADGLSLICLWACSGASMQLCVTFEVSLVPVLDFVYLIIPVHTVCTCNPGVSSEYDLDSKLQRSVSSQCSVGRLVPRVWTVSQFNAAMASRL